MPPISVPRIENAEWMPDAFTAWQHLDSLKPIPHRDDWGIYLIAVKPTAPTAGAADPLDPDIVLVGAAGFKGRGSSTLRSRVRALRHVLRGKDASHGPAYSVRQTFKKRSALANVYVAFYVVWEHDDDRSKALVMLLERIFIYNWIVQHGRRPSCNKE